MHKLLWKLRRSQTRSSKIILDAIILSSVFFLLFALTVEPGAAQHSRKIQMINNGTVGIISGGNGGTDLSTLRDLATVFDNGSSLRILPIIGRGSLQNIEDILYMRGVDAGIVQSDVLTYIKRLPGYDNIEARINYIAKLFDLEFHLVAGQHIQSVKDLAGKKVNFGRATSGTNITASAVFSALGVKVTPVHYDTALALKMVQDKKIAAAVFVAGKPDNTIRRLKQNQNIHLLTVDYAKPLRKAYLPAKLTARDYPDLIANGTSIRTVSVGSVMAVYNWTKVRSPARYEKVVRFIDAFIKQYKELKKPPRHPKWQDMNIAATVPGWIRFPPTQSRIEKLKRSLKKQSEAAAKTEQKVAGRVELNSFDPAKKALFFKFLRDRNVDSTMLATTDRKQLFLEFFQWQKENNTQ